MQLQKTVINPIYDASVSFDPVDPFNAIINKETIYYSQWTMYDLKITLFYSHMGQAMQLKTNYCKIDDFFFYLTENQFIYGIDIK